MQRVVRLDSRGRILLPREVREALGLREGSKIAIRVRSDNVIELVPLDKLYERVSRVFREKMRDWREEEHEATRVLEAVTRAEAAEDRNS
ncbi:transcriptional regulator, AbrB family [Pyrolobus fumarii 1A]|uniref:Transcriptional regulator, AbrB family n=1 Tax=Pyrolobus fumarii (strain DSM 11204 / 1A) TaxID=694429 RepID=G0ECP8_PYRF1|nr:AbrB/MazE/SpoVT family DNA-binding domain-containing protein [Pyrolobus fumarii]AEM39618.1 transcriptional regulator, AbrB family [Pyrolobus fumarii 1A]